VENQEHIRGQLDRLGLVAFVADGAILPRESGASDKPLPAKQAVAFQSPESLRVTIDLLTPIPESSGPVQTVSGMGMPKGVTLIVGGGYHGKSTLLRALERGVYPHIPRDGREFVVTCCDAVKIRAEDGRRVEQVDISPFIDELPYGRQTSAFCSDDASGSTSQAANIVEVLEVGAKVLLLDEDTSATNFMVRDGRMQALVHRQDEPITPAMRPSPVTVQILDRDQGIIHLAYNLDPYNYQDRILPSLVTNAPSRNMQVAQTTLPITFDSILLLLSPGYQLKHWFPRPPGMAAFSVG